ncbi:hypothetical protein ASU33_19610 [Solirubrum puertoriconensis]|uniref:Uncharacterized protein n=2 Tax=Solirubrum puertoriconensis TaxID=1751427 RepID=A0A9X0HNB7_SOLP1|nr:hypothetical protein ASU33_19610 [Solirubrum puertoriconensis]
MIRWHPESFGTFILNPDYSRITMYREVQNIFGRVFYRIEYNSAANIVEAEWQGAATQQDLRNAVVAGLEVHERTHCAYRLNDNTGFSGPWADSVAWLEEEWLPRAHAAGIRYLAHVARAGSFGEQAGEAMLRGRIGSQIEVALFFNRPAAFKWLTQKQGEQAAGPGARGLPTRQAKACHKGPKPLRECSAA